MRLLLRLLLCLMALSVAGSARAGEFISLDDSGRSFDAWSAVRVLADPDASLALDDVRARVGEFATPNVPENNFGPRGGALWLHVPLRQASFSARWVIEIDYPALNHIDVYLVREGRLQRHLPMGNSVPASERPMRTRSHAAMLDLQPDAAYDVYLRVQSTSALVVPIRFHHADAYVANESARLLLLGLMFGVGLMLLATSLVNGITLRDPVFAYYALMNLGVSLFFVSFSGLGHQFLWPVQSGFLAKVSPWGAILGLIGASLFSCGAMDLKRTNPRIALVLRTVAAVGTAVIVASMLDLLSYPQTSIAATALGPFPILLALWEALRRARRGERIAFYMALGWGAYAVGALSMALMLRGLLPADFWTQHLFQFASVTEMFAWMRVLALRIEEVKREAERSIAEKNALHSLAHTDPLTGLPNRRGLAAALEAALPAARVERALVVFLVDLDGFKAVNDRLGHDAGDELLVQVSKRLHGCLRASDVLARLGGDEFVVMALAIPDELAAERIGHKMLEAFRQPFAVRDQVCKIGLTIGFAIAPQDGIGAGDILRRADAAMYAGKQGGRGCVRRGAASAGLAASA